MTEHIGAAPYERTEDRNGHRNGHKPRVLRTRVGTLKLRVPQDRDGTFSTRLFARYQRSEQALVMALMEMYIQGVSTRKVAAITEELCGTTFSKSQVSPLAGRLDAELEAWRSRPLEAESYPYSRRRPLRARRVGGRVVSQGVLVVRRCGTTGGGRSWRWRWPTPRARRPTRSCSARSRSAGCGASNWSPATTTRASGRRIARHFQGASWQRCQVHFARNLLGMVGPKRQELAADLRAIFAARQGRRPRIAAARGPKWRGRPPEGRRAPRGGPGGVPGLPCVPREPPAAHPDHQRAGTAQPGAQAAHAGGAHLPQPRGVLRLVTALAMEQSEEWVTGGATWTWKS